MSDNTSDYSHNDVPWMVAENRKMIDYESVFYRTEQYSVRENDWVYRDLFESW